jgi:DNA-binding NarL/FixJ family response regulator
MAVVGQAEDGQGVVQLAAELKPDVVLMDIAIPLLNGLEAAPDQA